MAAEPTIAEVICDRLIHGPRSLPPPHNRMRDSRSCRAGSRILAAVLPALIVWCCPLLAWGAEPAAPSLGTPTPPPTSASDGAPVAIVWEAPPECPDADSVVRYAERLLGQPLSTPRSQRVFARATVRRDEAGNWNLGLLLTSNGHLSEETLVAKQCATLRDAVGLQVALATDPVAAARAIETDTITKSQEPRAPPIEPNGAAPPGEHPAEPRAQAGLRLAGGAELGLLPSIELGAALTLWVQRSAWRGELSGVGLGGSSAHFESMPSIGAHLQLYGGAARGCAVPRIGRAELPVCLGVELGVMRAEGFGAQMTDTSHSLWGAIVVGPAFRLPVTQTVSLWLGVDELVPFLRPGFNVHNLGTFYTAPEEATRIWAGCELRLR